jgi:hypothetical protein
MRTVVVASFFAFAFAALVAACSSSTQPLPGGPDAGKDATSCSLPTGYDCCDGDVEGTFTCDAKGAVVCSSGTRLTPSNQCTLPPPRDAGHDSSACQLPTGYDCCDGDQLGTFACGADGGVECLDGTRLTPSDQCRTPPPRDGGNDSGDAQACAPPAGYVCCQGDVTGAFVCEADGGTHCEPGMQLIPVDQCGFPPADGGGPSDASHD